MKKTGTTIVPRLIRVRDVPGYLGMDRNRFNGEVRPLLTEIPIGDQGIAFDRLELDAWVEDYKSRNGRRLKASKLEDDVCNRARSQHATKCQDYAKKVVSGTLKNAADMRKVDGSGKARAHLRALRRNKS